MSAPAGTLSALLSALALAGCSPSIVYSNAPEPLDERRPDIDLEAVRWPAVAEPLPTGAPWWLNGLDASREARASHRVDSRNAYTQYSQASPVVADSLGQTVVYCHVSYAGGAQDPRPVFRAGRRARADLTVRGVLGDGLPFVAVGADNARSVTFAAPTMGLELGDRIELRVVDRDFIVHDSLGSVSMAYEGRFPIEASNGSLSARCVALDPARVAGGKSFTLRTLDSAIATAMQELERPPSLPDTRGDDPVPRPRWELFEDSLFHFARAADRLSLSDTDLQLRRARLDALIDAHEAEARAAYLAVVEQATRGEVTLSNGARVSLLAVACHGLRGGAGCRLRLRVLGPSALLRAQLHSPTHTSSLGPPTFERVATQEEHPDEAATAPAVNARVVALPLHEPWPVAGAGQAPLLLQLTPHASAPSVLLYVPADLPLERLR